MPSEPSTPRISILLVPFADYSLDYMRFFYDNRDVLARHGVVYPLTETLVHHTFCQQEFAHTFFRLSEINKGDVRDEGVIHDVQKKVEHYLSRFAEFDDAQEILLLGHIWGVEAYATFLRLLDDPQRFPRLCHADKCVIWIEEPRSSYVEGGYRYLATRPPLARTLQQATQRNTWWCEFYKRTSDICPDSAMYTLQERDGIAANLHNIFDILHYNFIKDCKKPVLTGTSNRDAIAFASVLSQWLADKEYLEFIRILHTIKDCFSKEENTTFIPPSELQAMDSTCAAILGRDFNSMSTHGGSESWHPHEDFMGKRFATILDLLMNRCSPYLRKRLLVQVRTHAYCFPSVIPPSTVNSLTNVDVVRPEPAISVLTLTKNHAPYIAACMDSVLAQHTSMQRQHIIVDDFSTDDTRRIIYEYASRHDSILPIFLQCYSGNGENVRALFNACRSPYAALCDGDDYFTDLYKLQKQLEFLDAHRDCSMCFHPVQVIYEDGTARTRVHPSVDQLPRGVRPFYYLADMFKANFIQTNSVMYRWRFTEGLPEWFRGDLVPGDWYWHLLHAEMGKIGFINEVMSAYRRHRGGLFYSAETKSTSVPHRLAHGMSELRMFDTVNKHFGGRYARPIMSFASNVLADFLQHYMTTKDDSLLKDAEARYPDFVRNFLHKIQLARAGETQ